MSCLTHRAGIVYLAFNGWKNSTDEKKDASRGPIKPVARPAKKQPARAIAQDDDWHGPPEPLCGHTASSAHVSCRRSLVASTVSLVRRACLQPWWAHGDVGVGALAGRRSGKRSSRRARGTDNG